MTDTSELFLKEFAKVSNEYGIADVDAYIEALKALQAIESGSTKQIAQLKLISISQGVPSAAYKSFTAELAALHKKYGEEILNAKRGKDHQIEGRLSGFGIGVTVALAALAGAIAYRAWQTAEPGSLMHSFKAGMTELLK